MRKSSLLTSPGGRAIVLLVVFAIPVACLVPVSPHGWSPERGPVVPHDTFPARCDLCHVTGNWHTLKEDFTYDHAKETGVVLEGAHRDAECLLCHNDRGPAGMFAARGCGGCHEDIHRGKMGDTCDACHDSVSWAPLAQIAKHAETRFPLVGAHAVTACFACHPGATVGNFERLTTDCLSCHQNDFAQAVDPNHRELGWTDCAECHIPTAFSDVRFAHPGGFPLNGAHASLGCRDCHEAGTFSGLDPDCAACHRDDYDATNDPNHLAAGFSLDCQACHNTTTFDQARFDHDAFRLSGAHRTLSCNRCHVNNVFSGTPTDCVDCHRSDYEGVQSPNHVTGSFSTDCTVCHGQTAWKPAAFDHTAFPLTGAHTALTCSRCHENGVFAGTPTDCVDCHRDDYDGTTDPNHNAAGFPLDCDACHGTSTWQGARFDHAFPITSGAHRTLSCTDCHTNPSNYASFTCTDCHDHRQSEMDDKHREVRGYVYSSPSCLDCHPNGRGD